MSHRPIPPLIEMIRALIATPSVSSVSPEFDMSNRPVADLLANWCEDAGFRVELQKLDAAPGKVNLIASLGRGDGGLALAGHTDTVPYDKALWSSDPFKLRAADDRLYGLGSADMKSFFAFALEAATQFDAAAFRRPLVLVATADEESDMFGGRALAGSGLPGVSRVVIGEPTRMRPVRMHKGILMESIRVLGQSGHSSDPALGANAVEGMHAIIAALLDYRTAMQQAHRDEHFAVPLPTLNFGAIRGGDNPNRICGECELHIDLRTLPGMTTDAVREAFQQRCRDALAGTPFRLEFRRLFEGIDAMETPAESALVAAAERLTGAESEAVSFGTEAPFFRELGLDTIVLGPGDIAQAHQPDEYLGLDMIEPARNTFKRLIEEFCLK
ncbi:MAG TPA: acetylornithine deacetylase [Gammaproteobacteria bacterium]|nr:acetylornithine deacetylase [Gammaproteobacteria bacterium]